MPSGYTSNNVADDNHIEETIYIAIQCPECQKLSMVTEKLEVSDSYYHSDLEGRRPIETQDTLLLQEDLNNQISPANKKCYDCCKKRK